MKIFERSAGPIEFEDVEQGMPFYYGNNKTLCMKVTIVIKDNCSVNTVELKTGKLFKIYDSEVVIPAHVHIEND